MEMSLVKIRDFVLNLFDVIISLIKIIVLSKFTFNSKLKSYRNQSLVILGNGPSLNTTLENEDFIGKHKLLCVNYFGRTEEYVRLKPSFYVITSLEYFFNDDKKEFAIVRKKTLEDIAEKTDWPIILFLPAKAKQQNQWKNIFVRNSNISIYYFNTTPVAGFDLFSGFCFSQNLGMPRPHNVLIPSLILSIKMRFKKIYIAGADHSWLKEINVTQANEVLLSQKHFYDNQSKRQSKDKDMSFPKPMYQGGSTKARKLHEILEKFYYTFRSYWKIKAYAKSKEVEIYNITPISYIDAFSRIDITNNSN
jgi:hypothetical protein